MLSRSHREFWMVLSYIYIKYNKIEKAFVLLRALYKLFPQDLEILKLFAYVNLRKGNFMEALKLIDKYLSLCEGEEKKIGYLIKSQVLWKLNKREDSREFMDKFMES